MRTKFLSALCFLLFSPAVFADFSWYLGAGGSYSTLKVSNFAADSGVAGGLAADQTLETGRFKDDTFGWQIFGAMMFNRYFGIGVKYYDSGDAKDQWVGTITTSTVTDPGPPPQTTVTETDTTFDGTLSVDGYTISLLQTLPIGERFEYTLAFGYTVKDVDFSWTSPDLPGSLSDDDSGFAASGILRYKIFEHFALSGEIEYSTVDFSGLINNPVILSLNAEVHF